MLKSEIEFKGSSDGLSHSLCNERNRPLIL